MTDRHTPKSEKRVLRRESFRKGKRKTKNYNLEKKRIRQEEHSGPEIVTDIGNLNFWKMTRQRRCKLESIN